MDDRGRRDQRTSWTIQSLLWGIFNNQLNKNRYLARTRDDEDTDVVRTTWHFTTINLTSTRDMIQYDDDDDTLTRIRQTRKI